MPSSTTDALPPLFAGLCRALVLCLWEKALQDSIVTLQGVGCICAKLESDQWKAANGSLWDPGWMLWVREALAKVTEIQDIDSTYMAQMSLW